MATTKTSRNAGYEYAEFLCAEEIVDINEMLNSSISIPQDDYNTMILDGIENPDAEEYWTGYNQYVSEKS